MLLRTSAMNRSLNRENPNILVVMIAEREQIMKDPQGRSVFRARQRAQREEMRGGMGMGPQKPAIDMSGTAPPKSKCFLSLSLYRVALPSLSILMNGSIPFIPISLSLCRSLVLAFLTLSFFLLMGSL